MLPVSLPRSSHPVNQEIVSMDENNDGVQVDNMSVLNSPFLLSLQCSDPPKVKESFLIHQFPEPFPEPAQV